MAFFTPPPAPLAQIADVLDLVILVSPGTRFGLLSLLKWSMYHLDTPSLLDTATELLWPLYRIYIGFGAIFLFYSFTSFLPVHFLFFSSLAPRFFFYFVHAPTTPISE